MSNTRIFVWAVWAVIGVVLLICWWLYFTGPTTIPPADPVYTPPITSPSIDIPIDTPTNDLPQGGKG